MQYPAHLLQWDLEALSLVGQSKTVPINIWSITRAVALVYLANYTFTKLKLGMPHAQIDRKGTASPQSPMRCVWGGVEAPNSRNPTQVVNLASRRRKGMLVG